MNILLIEPFYSGSHKQFADQFKEFSKHNITLLTLDGKYWKWRMYGAAITLAEMFNNGNYQPDLILATDMLDLPVFLSGVRHTLKKSIPILTYFHENQIAYPWQEHSQDVARNRDVHYGMMNYQTAYASDLVLFNSAYNMNSFYDGLDHILSKMPDYRHTESLRKCRNQSEVLPLGLSLSQLSMAEDEIRNHKDYHPDIPLILWNHRWEHDKNPELFFKGLHYLKSKGITFHLALVGKDYKNMPSCFSDAKKTFAKELIHYGYCDKNRYRVLLNLADILPVTSNHEFFGISVMEAIHCNTFPLLPKRLSYVELYNPNENPEIFYNSENEFFQKLEAYAQSKNKTSYKHITELYDWETMIQEYDLLFERTHNLHNKML